MTSQVVIVQGDALRLPLPDRSVHAIVTDPPYGLEFMGKDWDKFKGANDWSRKGHSAPWVERPKGGTDPFQRDTPIYRAGQPYQAWCEQWATEAFRVLRPGGWLLAFGGTRTWHRLACGIEDAGFEMRDTIAEFSPSYGPLAWCYGSGFPKSRNVSKEIDKRAEANIETARRIAAVAEVIRQHRVDKGLTPQQVSLAIVGTPSGACWNWEHQQLPSLAFWPSIKALLGIPDHFDGLLEGDRSRFIAAEREVTGYNPRPAGWFTSRDGHDLTAPATPEAERWQGWGTALKPSWEPVIVARKPLSGTVAQNVLTFGTGALNIDASRIGMADNDPKHEWYERYAGNDYGVHNQVYGPRSSVIGPKPSGRWPPNVALIHSPGCQPTGTRKIRADGAGQAERSRGGLLNTTGENRGPRWNYADADGMEEVTAWACQPDCSIALLDQQSGERPSGSRAPGVRKGMGYHGANGDGGPAIIGNTGSSSRFFYTAKAGPNERVTIDGEGHPTVKPLKLVQWLVRLVTPPGGLVLDMFAGSGTTGEAAMLEGFRCILIDKDPSNFPSIRVRTHPYVRRTKIITNGSQTGPEQGSLL